MLYICFFKRKPKVKPRLHILVSLSVCTFVFKAEAEGETEALVFLVTPPSVRTAALAAICSKDKKKMSPPQKRGPYVPRIIYMYVGVFVFQESKKMKKYKPWFAEHETLCILVAQFF